MRWAGHAAARHALKSCCVPPVPQPLCLQKGACAAALPGQLAPAHLVRDVEGNVKEGGAVGVPRHLQLLHRRQPVVRVLAQLQRRQSRKGQAEQSRTGRLREQAH